jgi:hypothetical protein
VAVNVGVAREVVVAVGLWANEGVTLGSTRIRHAGVEPCQVCGGQDSLAGLGRVATVVSVVFRRLPCRMTTRQPTKVGAAPSTRTTNPASTALLVIVLPLLAVSPVPIQPHVSHHWIF